MTAEAMRSETLVEIFRDILSARSPLTRRTTLFDFEISPGQVIDAFMKAHFFLAFDEDRPLKLELVDADEKAAQALVQQFSDIIENGDDAKGTLPLQAVDQAYMMARVNHARLKREDLKAAGFELGRPRR